MPSERHLLLVDCSAFAYRAFYSLPAMRREGDGEPTGAVLQFMKMLWNMLGAAQADKPGLGAAVFDAPGKNFRHDLFPDYKGNRSDARRLELKKQLPIMRPVAEVLGLTVVEKKGFEADDLIATLAVRAMAEGIRTTIVSSDKDFGQLVKDGWIEIVDPMQKVRDATKSARRLEADVVKRFGVKPHLVKFVQALAGDPVDNIPGVPGVGLDKAGRLIRRFGSLDGVLDNIDECRWPAVRRALRQHADKARLSLELATLRQDVDIEINFAKFEMRPIMKDEIEQVAKKLDPAANIQFLFGLDLQNARVVDRVDDPLAWWREELRFPGQRLPETPACGFYKTRMIRGGPWVPARIWREAQTDPSTGADTGYDLLRCEVHGKPRDPLAAFPGLCLNPIRENEFRFQEADFAHAAAYRHEDPKASPDKPIDLPRLPAPINPRTKRKII